VRSSPIRFAMDELEIVRALREIDERGWILGAIVHSHPNGPATPSRTDLAEAFYPGSLMVIVSFATEKPDLRGWRLERRDDAWEPVEVPVVSGGGVAKCAANCAPFSGS
jgi:proteasome lid subunit RPN8/RPN11